MRWLTSILVLLVCPAWAADYKDITGLWRGQVDRLPALAMTISDEGGEFTLAILFYMIRREDGQPPRSSPGTPEPMFNLGFDGNALSRKPQAGPRCAVGKQSLPLVFK